MMPAGMLEGIRDVRELPGGARLAWLSSVFGRERRSAAAIARAGALPANPLVLVVCYGNIYRSPMAAALLRQLVAKRPSVPVRVVSSGLHDRVGRPSPDDAQRIAPEFGVSLADHASSSMTAMDAEMADLIVVMDRRNEAMVQAKFPAHSSKIILLGALDPLVEVEGSAIPDPYGHGDAAVRAVYARIARCVGRLHDLLSFGRDALPSLSLVKRTARRMLVSPTLAPLWERFTADSAAILMLHRFEDRERGIAGHSPDVLAANLEFLRQNDYNISSLDDVVKRMVCGEPPLPRTVVFTVDDGYADFARVGAPVFAKYDCPATLFLTTGFVDGECWLWYDAVKVLIGHEPKGSLRFELANREEPLEWQTPAQRHQLTTALIERMKSLPTHELEQGLASLTAASAHVLPARPPHDLAPISWDDVQHWGARGMSFGAHARTHPILSRADAARSHREIVESFARMREATPYASLVFAYPNGLSDDFGERERNSVLAAGMMAAVASTGGHCALSRVRADRFAIPRIPYSDDIGDVRQSLIGVERVKQMLRSSAP